MNRDGNINVLHELMLDEFLMFIRKFRLTSFLIIMCFPFKLCTVIIIVQSPIHFS